MLFFLRHFYFSFFFSVGVMGVSGLLREILKKYPSIHFPVPHPNIKKDYLFIDFNAFIYNTINAFLKEIVYDFSKNK
jgi:hypothetical protein